MEDLEAFVVGTVAGTVDIKQRNDQARPLRVAADTAGRLNVLGARLGLAQDDHEPQS